MICERCQNKVAAIKIVQIINNEKVFKYYCDDCALEMGLDTPISLQDFFKGILDMSMNNNIKPSTASKKTYVKNSLKCYQCGTTYDDFRKIGKVGCSNCYSVFKKQLEVILKNVHGSSCHSGKIPRRLSAELLLRREVDSLRKQIAKAVEVENFEKAAELRDKIKELSKSFESI